MTSKTVQQVFCGVAEAPPVLMHDCQENIALGVNMGFPFTLFVSDPSFSSSTWGRSSLDTKLFVTSDSCSEVNNHINLRDKEISTKSRSRQNKIPRFVIDFITSETRKTYHINTSGSCQNSVRGPPLALGQRTAWFPNMSRLGSEEEPIHPEFEATLHRGHINVSPLLKW